MSTFASEPQHRSQSINLVRAAEAGDLDSVEALIVAGVDVNSPTEQGMTALMSAAANGHRRLVVHLLNRGADINAKRYDGLGALALAVFFGHLEVVLELVDRGADVTGKSRFGTSLDAWARARGFPEIARILTKAKSDESPCPPSDQSSAPVAEHIDVEKPRFGEALLADDAAWGEAHSSLEKASRITVQIHPNATHENEGTRLINLSARIVEARASLWNLIAGTDRNNQLLRWLARMTSDQHRLAVLTLVVMLVCGLCTFAILQLLNQKQKGKLESVSQRALLDSQRLSGPKRDVDSTTPGEGNYSKPHATSGERSRSSIDSKKRSVKAAVVSPAPPIENLRNSGPGKKNRSGKSAERVEDLAAKKPLSIKTEAKPALASAPSLPSAKAPAKNNSLQFANGLELEKSGARTPPAEPPANLKMEIQRRRPATTGAPPALTATPLNKTKPKVIQWP